ncbi:thioredoxin TrxC [Methylotenera sp.]|uniref:thioredoxin TrxC n=1 Tax=Methylotenera sp. TaxID=2051956 RepID=UPI0027174350|nr:thioredoxin TrxC [Methylotenera sp.]MDO9205057.1 thioredoxin TrxC [Methylotenera sp.]MDO9392537.1 thioredoxin TrxC [Methylotenera sp.]MDP1523632.1 thioredoxin TrxC [Methylotenera sp.]MDP2071638.1 thioredoxin TrxC [Methylotenera sp.]MDP3006728.1 thioredoxin TrxC [Methylotenera sp.]
MQIKCPHCGKENRFPINKVGENPICGACRKSLLTEPIVLNQTNINEVLSQSILPVIIDFWAPWCGPCKMFAPTFKASAAKFANQVIYAKVDTETEQLLGAKYNIRSIPTLAYFWMGKELGRVSGAMPAGQLNELVINVIQAAKTQ